MCVSGRKRALSFTLRVRERWQPQQESDSYGTGNVGESHFKTSRADIQLTCDRGWLHDFSPNRGKIKSVLVYFSKISRSLGGREGETNNGFEITLVSRRSTFTSRYATFPCALSFTLRVRERWQPQQESDSYGTGNVGESHFKTSRADIQLTCDRGWLHDFSPNRGKIKSVLVYFSKISRSPATGTT